MPFLRSVDDILQQPEQSQHSTTGYLTIEPTVPDFLRTRQRRRQRQRRRHRHRYLTQNQQRKNPVQREQTNKKLDI